MEQREESFARIDAEYRERILRYLRRMIRDSALAEDLTQETFLRASRGLADFRGESSLKTWLYRIATNVALDELRRERARPSPEALRERVPLEATRAAFQGPEPRLPDRLLEDSEMGRCVREFVEGLPAAQRTVIVLHDLEGLKNQEIAEILTCSLESVKIRVHRARQKLRALLSEHCELEHSAENVLHCDRKPPSGR